MNFEEVEHVRATVGPAQFRRPREAFGPEPSKQCHIGRHLPNGWRFGLPNERFVTNGKSYDGPGIPPTIVVPVFPPTDIASGRDGAIEKAFELLGATARTSRTLISVTAKSSTPSSEHFAAKKRSTAGSSGTKPISRSSSVP